MSIGLCKFSLFTFCGIFDTYPAPAPGPISPPTTHKPPPRVPNQHQTGSGSAPSARSSGPPIPGKAQKNAAQAENLSGFAIYSTIVCQINQQFTNEQHQKQDHFHFQALRVTV